MKNNYPHIYTLTMAACVQFVVLTLAAMLFYPGGTLTDPTTDGYRFFANFFSDLGMVESHAGPINTVSSALFVTALTLAGLGLVLFFLTFPNFFSDSLSGQILSWLGSVFGVICGFSFVGVAFTPADRFISAHINFVYAAFTTFLMVVLLYSAAIYRQKDYPNQYAVVLLVFAALLAGYLWLLFYGPGANTAQGVIIQATGQKVIVYATIVSMLVVADGARRQSWLRRPAEDPANV